VTHFRPWPPLFAARDLVMGPLLVLAPHPDDEIIGAGGLLAAHVEAGERALCVIVTDGALGDPKTPQGKEYVERRRDESRAAARSLGAAPPEFLAMPDGGLADLWRAESRRLIAPIAALLARERWATVAFPSPYEVHPDHRATALAVLEAARASAVERLLAYEIGEMMPVNLLIDLTPYAARKMAALECFASQLAHQDLRAKLAALNRARTVNCDDPAVAAAEAYLRIDPARAGELAERVDAIVRVTDEMAPRVPYA
jgi:LmbE family N-acetylglucosaminyl deacetylase